MSDNEESDNSSDLDGGLDVLELDEEADRACDDDVRAYYDSLTPDVIGNGWFDQRMTRIHVGLDIANSRTFYTEPADRNYPSPAQLPTLYPLRAVAWILEQAPAGSTVRAYCGTLCCPMAIDLIIHHGANKTVKIIMNPSGQTTNRLEKFFLDHGRISFRAFRDRLQLRVAYVSGANCGRDTSLHDKSVMTDLHTTFGSYSLANGAMYQNWELLHVADSEPSHAAHFDALWNSLAGRNVQIVFPDLALAYPPTRSPRPPGNEGRATRRQRIRWSISMGCIDMFISMDAIGEYNRMRANLLIAVKHHLVYKSNHNLE
jgi:hypothetical protein